MEKKKEFLTMVVILLFAAGIFFHEGKAIFAAFSITLLLLTDLFLLHKNTEKTASLFRCSRMVDKTIIVRGKSTGITTESAVTVLPGTGVQTEDLIPKGSVVTSGTTQSPVLHTSGTHEGTYSLLCLAHGINRFEGIKLRVSDRFFSEHLVLRKKSMCQPEIRVFPRPSFLSGRTNQFSGKKTNKQTLLKGDDVKGLREYNTDDDIRKIDWKASAKYDKLFIKEYTGIEGDMQMLFIDLPDRDDTASGEKIERLKGAAASILMNEDQSKPVTIIEISGPNIIAVKKSKTVQSEAFDLINRITPAPREKYLYRYPPRQYAYEKTGPSDFASGLSRKAGQFFRFRSPHLFEKQTYNLLGNPGAGKEIFVVTLPGGDTSHLKIIARIARFRELRPVCFIPHDETTHVVPSGIRACGFDEVNLI